MAWITRDDAERQRVVAERLPISALPSLLWFGVALLAHPEEVVQLPVGDFVVEDLAALRDALTSLGYGWRTVDGGVAITPREHKRGSVRVSPHLPIDVAAVTLIAASQSGPSPVEIYGIPSATSELVELAELLNAMGAEIAGVGTPVTHAAGRSLRATTARPGRDADEALSLLLASALAGSFVVVDVPSHRMAETIQRLGRVGITVASKGAGLAARGVPVAFDLEVLDEPCAFLALALIAEGASVLSGASLASPSAQALLTELTRLGADLLPRGDLVYVGGGRERAPKRSKNPVRVSSAAAARALLLLSLSGLIPDLVVEVIDPVVAAPVARFVQSLGLALDLG